MDLRPTDRRGLGEVVAWCFSLATIAICFLAELFKTGQVDNVLLGPLIGITTALLARGTQGAAERSARNEQARQLESAAQSWAKRAEDAAKRAEEASNGRG